MTLAASVDSYQFPIVPQTSSFTRRAEVKEDPLYRLLNATAHDFSVLALNPLKRRLNDLRSWPENWDGFGSLRPSEASVDHALVLLPELYKEATSTGLKWVAPHVGASESGEIVLEWWGGRSKLTIYVGPESIQYIRVWGPNIENEMDDGELGGQTRFASLWQWLNI